MKFKTDENLPVEVARTLASRGHDAVSVVDQHLGGTTDDDLARVCVSENRILVTLDTDFADIKAYPPGEHPGIIVLRLSRQEKNAVVGVIRRLLDSLQLEDPEGNLWIVDDHRIRVRDRGVD